MEVECWKPEKNRFIVEKAGEIVSPNRRFANGECVFNQKLGMAYSVDEIVEVLNIDGEFSDYFFELIQEKIWYCQAQFHETGDEHYLIEEECLRTLRDEIHNRAAIFEYRDFLMERHKQIGNGEK